MIDFIIEIPHLGFKKSALSIAENEKNIYIAFFVAPHEAIGDWRKGVFIDSAIFQRKEKVNVSTFRDNIFGKKPAIKTNAEAITPQFVYNKKTRKLKGI